MNRAEKLANALKTNLTRRKSEMKKLYISADWGGTDSAGHEYDCVFISYESDPDNCLMTDLVVIDGDGRYWIGIDNKDNDYRCGHLMTNEVMEADYTSKSKAMDAIKTMLESNDGTTIFELAP